MKLHSPELERTLIARCTAAIRESPELRQASLRAATGRSRFIIVPLIRLVISGVVAWAVWLMASETGQLASALAVITLTGFFYACGKASGLLSALHNAPDLPILALLPASDDTIFKWELSKYVRQSLGSLMDFTVAYAVLAFYYRLSVAGFVGAFVIAILTWAVVMVLPAIGAAYFPKAPYWIPAVTLLILPFAIAYSETFRQNFVTFITTHAFWINAVLPTGYAVWLFDLLLPPPEWWHLAMLVPVATLLWIGKVALVHLRHNYHLPGTVIERACLLDEDDDFEDEYPAPVDATRNLGPTEIEDHVASRTFLTPQMWHTNGFFERILWNRLTARERVLTEFAFPEGISIADTWAGALKLFAATCAISSLVSLLFPTLALWLLGIGLFVGLCICIGQIGGGRAFGAAQISGVTMARHSLYAIGYQELGRLIFKHATVQLPMLMAYAIAASAALAYAARLPIEASLMFGVKAGGVLFAGTFAVVILGFSGATNDTLFRWRELPFLTALLFLALLELALGLAAFLEKGPGGWICWLLMIANSYALYRLYGAFYNRGAFDSMRLAGE